LVDVVRVDHVLQLVDFLLSERVEESLLVLFAIVQVSTDIGRAGLISCQLAPPLE
jgi:hypothetical protein